MAGAADPYFQCVGSSTGPTEPANPDGSQTPGVNCNKIPAGLISSIGQGLMNLYPPVDPNNPQELPAGSPTSGYNYVTEPVRSLNETKFDARIDQAFTAADNLFARFSYDQASSFAPGGAPAPYLAEGNPFGSNENLVNHARNIAIGETHVFSPNIVNQASFGYDRIFDYIASQDNFTCESAQLGIPNADLGCSSTGTPFPAAHTVKVWFPLKSWAAIGPSAIAATHPFRAEPIFTPSRRLST